MRNLLKAVIAALDEHSVEAIMCRHVLEYGKLFVPTARPKGLRKRRGKLCFYNAQDTVLGYTLEATPYLYCEGYALRDGVLMHHAWISDDGQHAIEMTWPTPASAYMGITYTAEQVGVHNYFERAWCSMLVPLANQTVDNRKFKTRVN